MTWLYILLAVILLLTAILFIPIGIKISYSKQLNLTLLIGFIRLRLIPSKPKKEKHNAKQEKKPKAKKAQAEESKKPKNKKSITDIIEIIKKIAYLAENVLKEFVEHIIIKKMMISFVISGDDAADAAIKYGCCCSSVYPAVGIIARGTNCKSYGVDISANFDEKANSSCVIDFEAKILLCHLAALVIKHGITGIKLMLDFKDKENVKI